jgi:hypothetical protein
LETGTYIEKGSVFFLFGKKKIPKFDLILTYNTKGFFKEKNDTNSQEFKGKKNPKLQDLHEKFLQVAKNVSKLWFLRTSILSM